MKNNEFQKKKVGARIRVIRKKLGLTMKEFGEKFDPPASDSIVSRWERGISSPNNERLERIADLGDMSVLYLTTGEKALQDLNDEEIQEYFKAGQESLAEKTKKQKEALKNDIELISNSDLDYTEVIYLNVVLDFLRSAHIKEVIILTSIIKGLNDARSLRSSNTISENEKKEILQERFPEIESYLKSLYIEPLKEDD